MSAQPERGSLLVLPPAPASAAETLRGLADGGDSTYLAVDEILLAMGNYGFGLLILILALPNALPGPIIPGFSLPFALGIIVLCLQMLQGHARPLLPAWLRRREIKRERFRYFVDRVEPVLLRLEQWLKPRTSPFWRRNKNNRALALVLLVFATVLAMPIPITNGPLAFCICIVALGMFESDEKVQTIGVTCGVLALIANAAMVMAGVQLYGYATEYLGW